MPTPAGNASSAVLATTRRNACAESAALPLLRADAKPEKHARDNGEISSVVGSAAISAPTANTPTSAMPNNRPITKLAQRSFTSAVRLNSHDQNENPAICRHARSPNRGRHGCIT